MTVSTMIFLASTGLKVRQELENVLRLNVNISIPDKLWSVIRLSRFL
jgi:hypothetical protein